MMSYIRGTGGVLPQENFAFCGHFWCNVGARLTTSVDYVNVRTIRLLRPCIQISGTGELTVDNCLAKHCNTTTELWTV